MFFYMVVYNKKFPTKTLLKKRFFKKPISNNKQKIKFGEIGLYLKKSTRFEFIYFFYIRKFLKKILKKHKRFLKITKIWIFIRPNHVLTKKSKNSRMGKGKGAFVRWCSLLPKGFVFLECKNISLIKLIKYKKKLEKKIRIPMGINYKHNSNIKYIEQSFLGVIDKKAVLPTLD